jgi:HlyD family secretion protein
MPQGAAVAGAKQKRDDGEVSKGDLVVEVVDTGNIEAVKSVEVKSQVNGRLDKLMVDDGDVVTAGQLIAVVDPQQTQLTVNQQKAQLTGALAGLQRQKIDTEKRRVQIQNNIARMKSRLSQMEMELKNQPALTQASVDSAANNVAAQEKALDALIHVTQLNTVTAVKNAVTDAGNNLRNAQLEMDRRKGLLEKGYASSRDVETAQLQVELAQSRLAEARDRQKRIVEEQRIERERQERLLAQAKSELDRATANRFVDKSKQEEYRQAQQQLRDAENDLRDLPSLMAQQKQQQSSIDQLKFQVEDGDRQLRETQIKAPLTGVVAKRYIQAGELVTASGSFNAGTPIVRVDDRSKLLVKLNINEIDVARMQIGQNATLTVDAVPEASFTGKVTKLAPSQNVTTAGDAVVKYQVEVTLDSSDQRLKSGMSAKCRVRTVDLKNVVKIPINFLGTDDTGYYVMIAPADPKDKKAKPTRRDVKVGVKSATEIQITSGLTGNEKLVTPAYKGPQRKGMMQFGGDDEDQ